MIGRVDDRGSIVLPDPGGETLPASDGRQSRHYVTSVCPAAAVAVRNNSGQVDDQKQWRHVEVISAPIGPFPGNGIRECSVMSKNTSITFCCFCCGNTLLYYFSYFWIYWINCSMFFKSAAHSFVSPRPKIFPLSVFPLLLSFFRNFSLIYFPSWSPVLIFSLQSNGICFLS